MLKTDERKALWHHLKEQRLMEQSPMVNSHNEKKKKNNTQHVKSLSRQNHQEAQWYAFTQLTCLWVGGCATYSKCEQDVW